MVGGGRRRRRGRRSTTTGNEEQSVVEGMERTYLTDWIGNEVVERGLFVDAGVSFLVRWMRVDGSLKRRWQRRK